MSESLRLRKGSEMARSEPISWLLAPGYLAAGKVSLLVGDEGIGKSLWAIRAMAAVTNGQPWGPFCLASNPAKVILVATEDGWSDTIRPRLEVVQADLDSLYVFSESADGSGLPTFPADMEKLRGQQIQPSLVVVDAWIDTVAGGLDVKSPQKARSAVAPWKKYAIETSAAVLLVAHTNRGDSPKLRDTYGLSGALRQVARTTMYAAEDPKTGALLVGRTSQTWELQLKQNTLSARLTSTSTRRQATTGRSQSWSTREALVCPSRRCCRGPSRRVKLARQTQSISGCWTYSQMAPCGRRTLRRQRNSRVSPGTNYAGRGIGSRRRRGPTTRGGPLLGSHSQVGILVSWHPMLRSRTSCGGPLAAICMGRLNLPGERDADLPEVSGTTGRRGYPPGIESCSKERGSKWPDARKSHVIAGLIHVVGAPRTTAGICPVNRWTSRSGRTRGVGRALVGGCLRSRGSTRCCES
jgi:hypothetical protein